MAIGRFCYRTGCVGTLAAAGAGAGGGGGRLRPEAVVLAV